MTDPSQDDHDPTGIRELLSSLPAPGPMPADLVARIEARLADEQDSRAAEVGSAPVVALRPRSSLMPRIAAGLGAAAAAVLIGAVAVAVITSSSGGSTSAGSGAVLDSGHPAAPQSGAEGLATDRGLGGTPNAATNPAQPSTTAYTSRDLVGQVQQALRRQPTPAMALASAAAQSTCLDAIGLAGLTPRLLDSGTFDGQPAVVLVVDQAGRELVRVVTPACGEGDPTLLGQATLP